MTCDLRKLSTEPYVLYDIEPAGSCKDCGGLGKVIVKNEVDGSYDGYEPCKLCDGDGAYSGGTYKLSYARKLGREVHKVIIK